MKKSLFATPFLLLLIACASTKWSSTWLKSLNDWTAENPEKDYSMQIDESIRKKPGVPSLRFELRHAEGYEGINAFTFRSDISTNILPEKFSEQWYSCSILLPRNFPIEENRLVLMQWWPKTKTNLGEVGRHPSLSLRFSGGVLSAVVRHSDVPVIREPDAVPAKVIFQTSQFSLGRWHDFTFQVKWSPQKDGRVKMWWNNKEVADYQGPVGYDDPDAPLFRFGLYRDDSEHTYVAHFTECRLGKTQKSVQAN